MSEERKVTSRIKMEGARLIFRNFQGKASDFNEEGNRNFGVLLDDEQAEILKQDGWNVKYLAPREDDPDQYRQPWLSVKVKFENFPPTAVLINSRGRVNLDEETINQLDWCRIKNCDLMISPYNYSGFRGRSGGVAAYLKAIYVTIEEDELEQKYASIPMLDGDTTDRLISAMPDDLARAFQEWMEGARR